MNRVTRSYQNSLQALRLVLNGEFYQTSQQDPSYEADVQPLVIGLSEWLKNQGINDKDTLRYYRLKMLGTILQKEVSTTYDLTKFQCNVIYQSLFGPDAIRPEALLVGLKNSVKKPPDSQS